MAASLNLWGQLATAPPLNCIFNRPARTHARSGRAGVVVARAQAKVQGCKSGGAGCGEQGGLKWCGSWCVRGCLYVAGSQHGPSYMAWTQFRRKPQSASRAHFASNTRMQGWATEALIATAKAAMRPQMDANLGAAPGSATPVMADPTGVPATFWRWRSVFARSS